MFDDLNKNPEGQETKGPKPVEDIFSSTEEAAKVEKPAVFQPKAPEPYVEEGAHGFDKRYFVLGLLVLGVIALGAGGYYFYNQYQGKQKTMDNNVEQKQEGTQEQQDAQNQDSNQSADNAAVNTPPTNDQDQDGITDEEESALGTNANDIDSDTDGLFDREEVKVYKTNPMNPDTDGDGHQDGIEVKNGFNPNGPGKLFEVQ